VGEEGGPGWGYAYPYFLEWGYAYPHPGPPPVRILPVSPVSYAYGKTCNKRGVSNLVVIIWQHMHGLQVNTRNNKTSKLEEHLVLTQIIPCSLANQVDTLYIIA